MELLEELKKLGVDVDGALKRLMGNKDLYMRMLISFPPMMEKASMEPGFDFKNYEEIQNRAHAVKGVSGNLSLTPIYEAYSDIVSFLRNGRPEEANEVLKEVMPVQTDIINCINDYSKQQGKA